MSEQAALQRQFKVDQLDVRVYADKAALAQAAARRVAEVIHEAVRRKGYSDIVVATGASQFEFLAALVNLEVPWKQVRAFHLDEYVGLSDRHPASFRKYLKERLFDVVRPAEVNLIRGDAPDAQAECRRYAERLGSREIDIACIGIGENGHVAFNDPPVADFSDPLLVKVVALDEACRRQQVGEGWFAGMHEVPTHAITQTVPAIMRAKEISCVVPDARKAPAVRGTVHGAVATACPASILRTHPACTLYLDVPAAGELER